MNIYSAINAIMAEVPAIGKNQKNAQQGFMYRGIDVVMNVLQPLLAKYKVFAVPEVLEQKREERTNNNGGRLLYSVCTIKYTFYADDGSSVSAVVIGEGMDSGDKATNKAMAIAFKYACFQVFCIPTEEMKDPDAETPPPSEPKSETKSPVSAKEPERFICVDCKNIITPYTDEHGKETPVRRIVTETQGKFKRPLCVECARKASLHADQ